MELPVQAQVECKDGLCGHTVGVLVDPTDEKVTHVVVEENEAPHNEYMVPIGNTSRSVAGTLVLNLTRAQLDKMNLFKRTHYIRERMPDNFTYSGVENYMGVMYYWPLVSLEREMEVPIDEYNMPEGETELERGTEVVATDGVVGKIDELMIDNKTKKITHLVMREGHLWGQKEVVIPVSAIAKTDAEVVVLNLDKSQVGKLPTVPVKRRW